MSIKKNDFIEIEFTGKVKDTDEIFDTNIPIDAKKSNLNIDIKKLKPFILSVGNKMLPVGFDKDLEGKEIGKEYSIEVNPEEAFGKRNSQMVKMIPLKVFHEQEINPQRGMQLNLRGQIARILSSSGGRVLVDFNNPLSGKFVIYKYKINKAVTDQKQKIQALQEFLFRKQFPFTVSTDKKIITFEITEKEKELEKFIELMSKPFEEILGMKVKSKLVNAKEEKKVEDKPSPKESKKKE